MMKRLIVNKQYLEYYTVEDDISQEDLKKLLETTIGEVQLLQNISLVKETQLTKEENDLREID